jgi:cytidylate kinase
MAKRSDIEQILDRQVRSWEVRRRLSGEGGEAAREALAHLTDGPWLTVSRQLGARGTELAQNIARELDWQVYDKEILKAIAEDDPSRERILSRLDQTAIKPFQELLARLLVIETSQVVFVRELNQVVWGLAKQGQAIILGRGANWFLDPQFGLRVRTVAPLEARVERVAGRDGTSTDTARKKIRDHEEQRRKYIEQYYGRSIDDPVGYDLIVNVSELSLQTATEVVLTALRRKLLANS